MCYLTHGLLRKDRKKKSVFALTLHGESFPRYGDVVLPLGGEAVMRQVVVLWEFHQRVICGVGGHRSIVSIRGRSKMLSDSWEKDAVVNYIFYSRKENMKWKKKVGDGSLCDFL